MIILDTNMLSEMMRATPNQSVVNWIEYQSRSTLFTTTITKAELLYGVSLLPDGKRKLETKTAIIEIIDIDLHGKVIDFDNESAGLYAEIASSRKKSGRPISQFDAMIAAITKSKSAKLATRNVKDFVDCGIDVINPWEN